MGILSISIRTLKGLTSNVIALFIASSLMLSGVEGGFAQESIEHTLSPVSGLKPIAVVDKNADIFKIIMDDPEAVRSQISELENNFRFMYLGRVIGKILEHFGIDITQEKLNSIINDTLSKVPDDRTFSWGEFTKDEDLFRAVFTDNTKNLSFLLSFKPSETGENIHCGISWLSKKTESPEHPGNKPEDGYISKGSRAMARMKAYIASKIESGQTDEMEIDLGSDIQNICSRLDKAEITTAGIAEAVALFFDKRSVAEDKIKSEIQKEAIRIRQSYDRYAEKITASIAVRSSRIVPAQVTSRDDFALGMGTDDTFNYYAEELISTLEGPLKEEYILHEILCPILGHKVSIVIQALVYPENYPKKGHTRGKLRTGIRKFIAKELDKTGEIERPKARPETVELMKNIDERAARMTELVDLRYPGDGKTINYAFKIAKEYHCKDFFKENISEMYIDHVLSVAESLERWGADTLTITAALLHELPAARIRKEFKIGSKKEREGIIGMADRLASINRLPYSPGKIRGKNSLQNYLNMIVKLASDPNDWAEPDIHKRFGYGTMMLSLADKLMTINTLSVSREKKECFDTIIQLYAPLAERLGLNSIASELRSESLRLNYAEIYENHVRDILSSIQYRTYAEAQTSLEKFANKTIKDFFLKHEIQIEEIKTRVKSPYSVWEKLETPSTNYRKAETLPDILGIMVITNDIEKANRCMAEALYEGELNDNKNRLSIKFHPEPKKGYEASHFSFCDNDGRKYELILMSPENYRRYRYGTLYRLDNWKLKPHWIYNLEREEDVKAMADKPALTPDEIEHSGNFAEDYELLLASLENKIFVLVEQGQTFKVLSLPYSAKPLDIAAHPQINRFTEYTGIELQKERGGEQYWHNVKEDVTLFSGNIVRMNENNVKILDPKSNVRHLTNIAKTSALVRTRLLAEDLGKKDIKQRAEKSGKIKLIQAMNVLYTGAKEKGLSVCEMLSKSLYLADIEELYAAIGLGLISLDVISDFIRSQTVRSFEIFTRHRPGQLVKVLQVLAEMDFNVSDVKVQPGLKNNEIGRVEITASGPAQVTNFAIFTQIMTIKGIKSFRVLRTGLKPGGAYNNPVKKYSHRLPKIIRGQDVHAALRKNMMSAGYDKESIEKVITQGIYRISSAGLEKKDDKIIDIVQNTLSDILDRQLTRDDMKDVIIDNHELIHTVIEKSDVDRLKASLTTALSPDRFAKLRLYYENMYGVYTEEPEFLEELAVNYFMERSLDSQIRLLRDPGSKERITLYDFDNRIENIIEKTFSKKVAQTEYYENIAGKTGTMFAYSLAARVFSEARKSVKKDIIIGIDTSWIPEKQMPLIQSLLSELTRMNKKKGFENVVIIRANGISLAGSILTELDKRKTDKANVIVIGAEDVLQSSDFNALRKAPSAKDRAFFAGVRKTEDFPENNHLRILDMIRVSLDLAFGRTLELDQPHMEILPRGERNFIFIPRAEPLDYDILRIMYACQKNAMIAA